MGLKTFFACLAAALLSGFAVCVLITALLDRIIWPSAFVGIPAGIAAGIIAFSQQDGFSGTSEAAEAQGIYPCLHNLAR